MSGRKFPGVYITDKNAFDNSVVGAETAIPVFIGLTEKAVDGSKSLLNQPVRITSMTEYNKYFGGAPVHKFNVSVVAPAQVEAEALSVDCGCNKLQAKLEDNLCTLYYHMILFFANGGITCYVTSIGDYRHTFAEAYTEEIKENVFTAIKKVQDITMLVVPEAVNSKSCMSIYTDLLKLCDEKKYFAILDIPTETEKKKIEEPIDNFRTYIGETNLQYSAAYYPWLETSVLSDNDIDGTTLFFNKAPDDKYSGNDTLDKYIANSLAGIDNDEDKQKEQRHDLHNALLQNWPAYKLLASKVKSFLNLLPPSAAMAGIYAMVDNTRGVWKAPANVSINYVNKLAMVINDDDKENLILPMNGKSVNPIRSLPGEGIKVWGARTLDGNSQDWRYINVRRTMTFLEQSVKNAVRAYVFEPNDVSTWIKMECMIENFLRSIWKRGGLAGSSPEDAFEVHVGLGYTMTPEDILEGIMRITVLVAVSRPAEFLEITFQQQMQES